MRPKRRRLAFVVCGMVALGAAAALTLAAFEDSIVYFYSPSDVAEHKPPPDRRFRIGGIVVKDSVLRAADATSVSFRVTDTVNTIEVAYTGILPDLFREGQGVVAEGRLDEEGRFRADEVLAKHDETYMPKEVADALKESGRWRGAPGGGE